MRCVYVWDREKRELVEKGEYQASRSTPYVISDSLDGVWNPCDGKRYDSKSQYYAAVKAHGGEIVGNDTNYTKKREAAPRAGHDIRDALRRQGF
jgi:hypothetical protein